LPGEYPRLVLAPGDAEEACFLAGEAMSLAWAYQTPAVVLLDKHLSESVLSSRLPLEKISVAKAKPAKLGPDYKRYAITSDGVSPLAFPGDKNTVVKSNSYEHDENGFIADRPAVSQAMVDKRFAKLNGLRKEQKKRETIKIFGDKKSKNAVVFWGSTKGAALEAMKLTKKKFRAIQIIWLEPMDEARLAVALKGAKKVIDLETNRTAQLAGLIREKIGLEIKNKILKYDAQPFDSSELAKKLDKVF